ncbi:MAG TPA: FecR domain-containing protein, partial [Ideonella sp.]|nr:FecR domain-containing protein [Ideonella sp.]
MDAAGLSAMREQAALWVVRLQEAGIGVASDAVRAECEAWCNADPRHSRMLEQMRGLWGAMAHTDDAQASDGAGPDPKRHARSRPRARSAGLLSLAALALLVAAWSLGEHGSGWGLITAWRADERAAVGEIRSVALPDGSRLTLNSGSAVGLDYGPDHRRIRLLAGEVLAEVAPDASRPFSVQGRDGDATARGTRFLMRQDAQDSIVTVLEHSVEVAVRRPARQAEDVATGVTVQTGQRVRLNAAGVGEVHDA